jgi:hypothetical protein
MRLPSDCSTSMGIERGRMTTSGTSRPPYVGANSAHGRTRRGHGAGRPHGPVHVERVPGRRGHRETASARPQRAAGGSHAWIFLRSLNIVTYLFQRTCSGRWRLTSGPSSSSRPSTAPTGMRSCTASRRPRSPRRERAASTRFPPPVVLCPFDLPQAGGLHVASLDELGGAIAVGARPPAPGPAGRKPLQPVALVKPALLCVDPAVTERHLKGLRVRHRVDSGVLLGELQPDAPRGRVLLGKPRFPGAAGREGDDPQFPIGAHGATTTRFQPGTSASRRRPSARSLGNWSRPAADERG